MFVFEYQIHVTKSTRPESSGTISVSGVYNKERERESVKAINNNLIRHGDKKMLKINQKLMSSVSK